MNNRDWTKMEEFKDFCKGAGVQPTKRQASKFRNKRGAAYKLAIKEFPKGEVRK